MPNKSVILDRDGVINEDTGYVYKVEDFKILPGVFEALIDLQKHNYQLIIITNQSGIGRSYYIEEDFQKLTNYMLKEFKKRSIKIEKVYHCPHKPEDNCECRKPKPKLALEAITEFDLDKTKTWVVGDKDSDAEMGKRANLRTLQIGKDVKDLEEAVQHILKNE